MVRREEKGKQDHNLFAGPSGGLSLMQMSMQVRGIPEVCIEAPQSPLGAEACRDSPQAGRKQGPTGDAEAVEGGAHFSEGSNCPVRLTIKTEP